MWKTVSRAGALLVIAVVMSLTWTQSGHTAACTVERGIDVLDILKQGVRHNVWIGLDTSGSMQGSIPGGTTKAAAARDVILTLMDELVDSQGDPLVNWGFTYYDLSFNRNKGKKCGDLAADLDGNGVPDFASPDANSDGLPDVASNCVGRDSVRIDPQPCVDYDPRNDIRDTLLDLYDDDDWNDNAGGTPNGVFLDEMSMDVGANYYPILRDGQKNFVILLTDGEDTCECLYTRWDDLSADVKVPSSANRLRTSDLTSALTDPFAAWSSGCTGPLPTGDIDNDGSCAHQKDVAAYNAGLKGRASYPRVDPDLDGSSGDIYVVGLGLTTDNKRRTNHLAWEASGVYHGRPGHPAFFADSQDELLEQFREIFSRIGVPESTVSLSSSVVGSVKEVVHTHTNTANGLTAADLIASGLDDTEVRTRRGSHRNNVLFTTSLTTPGFKGHLRAFNIYNVQSDGTRTADFTEIWDAGEMLQTRNLATDPRRIYFHRANGTGGQLGTTLGTTALTAADLGVAAGYLSEFDPTGVGAKTDADAVEIVEKVIQGWRLIIDETHGFYQSADPTALNFSQFETDGVTGNWKLFEATLAAPAVVLQPPRSPDVDPPSPTVEYGTFYEDRINRMTTVYLGTNGGMMHAFRADNGYEIYGYIPHDLLPKLPNFVENVVGGNNGVLNHEFFFTTSASVQDAYLQDAPSGFPEWRTVLAFGRGAGGKFLTALDISDVGDWDGTDDSEPPVGFQPPTRLFTVGNNDGVADLDINGQSYDGFGETWSIPVMGRVHSVDHPAEGQWVLFTGTGYGCVGTDEGRYLYVLKLEDGTVYRKLGPVADVVDGSAGDPGIDQNALVATPSLFNPHEPGYNDGRDFVTRVYIGDLQGVIHKLDATDPDPANWEFGAFFELTSEADLSAGQGNHDQPITVQAAVLKLVGSDTIYVFVGSGGDNRVELTDPERFKIAGVVDTDSASSIAVGDPAFQGDLITLDGGGGDQFFFDLPVGERMTVPPVLARNTATNGVVFFATERSVFDPTECESTFFGTLFAAGVTTGLGSFDLDPSTAGVQDSMDLGEGKVTGLFHRDEHLYVSKSGQIGSAAGTDVLGSDTFPEPAIMAGTVQVLVDGFRLSPF